MCEANPAIYMRYDGLTPGMFAYALEADRRT